MSENTSTPAEMEYEIKFDVPAEKTEKEVFEVIDLMVSELAVDGDSKGELSCKETKCVFTYCDDEKFSLLNRGATFREVAWPGHSNHRVDYKIGAVNTTERIEIEKMYGASIFPRYIDRAVQFFCLEDIGPIRKVARAETQHLKWTFCWKGIEIEISYDQFFREEKMGGELMFQEIEIELKKGSECLFEDLVKQVEEHLQGFVSGRVTEQKYSRVIRSIRPFEMLRSVFFHAFQAHGEHPTKARKAFRRANIPTPYAIHPCWCALTMLHETELPEQLRWDGALALALHDVLEDTEVGLPDGTSSKVAKLVDEMTFESYGEELDSWWKISKEAQLLKLYDKVSNLMDGNWMSAEKMRMYKVYTLRLAQLAEERYGDLNIVRIARAICT